jgi:hypothetical protein
VNRNLDLHLDREIAIEPKGSIIRLVRTLLFVHIFLVVFQVPIRAIVLDNTYIRDILPFTIVFLLLGIVAISGSFSIKRSYSLLEKLFLGYLLLGMLLILFWLLEGVPLMDAFREFRNHFFPVILFFVAKKTLVSSHDRNTIVNIIFIITLTLLLMTLVEYLLIKIIGYSPYIFPWYRYSFMVSDRYIGNAVTGSGYILPEETPILGLLGWPHNTAVILMALFAFISPYFFKATYTRIIKLSVSQPVYFSNIISYSIILLTAAVIFLILGVMTHMVSFLFILLIFPLLVKGISFSRNFLIIFGMSICALMNDSVWDTLNNAIIGGFLYDDLHGRESSLSFLVGVNPFVEIYNMSFISKFIGTFYYTGGSELRLLNYTLHFGLVWLFLFVGIFIVGISYARKIISNRFVKPYDRLFALGSIGLLSVYFLDMGHYAKTLFAPNIDILSICLGVLTSIKNKI